MKKNLLLLLCFFQLAVYGQGGTAHVPRTFKMPKGVSEKDYLPNTLIIKFRSGTPLNQIRNSGSILSSALFPAKAARIKNVDQLFESSLQARTKAVNGFDRSDTIGLDRIYELKFEGPKISEEVINQVLQSPMVEYAEPSYIYHTSYVPSDPFYSSSQSYLRQIKANQAWDLIRSSSGVVIAIVDSGSDMGHEDLRANLLLPGKDLVGASYLNMKEDDDPGVKSDSTDHGVRVSGLASAVSDNGVGVSSVAFNAKLMIVKAGADDNATAIYRGYEAIKFAADNGAHIINCSWGGPAAGAYGQDIINYAIAKGCLVIAAAGNEGSAEPEYPAFYSGVLAVTSVDINDRRSSFANYGSHISISAPGETFTTGNRNNYTPARGTSFSAAIVSSAAALVKARFPQFNMEQVREQLRVTSDNIDAINLGFAGRLGKGRLNVFRAVTETPPSIRQQKITLVDKSGGAVPPGDTLRMFFDLRNFLSPVNGLTVKLSSDNPNVQIIDDQAIISALGTLQTQTMVGAFRVYIKPDISDNERVVFKLTYTSGTSYTDSEEFSIQAALDYMNINANAISTTISSNGRIGFSGPEATKGQGFMYKGEQLLFESALLIANSPAQVSNNARNDAGGADEHFIRKVRVSKIDDKPGVFRAASEFDDSGNLSRLNLSVRHIQTAFAAAPDDKYIIAEYEIRNTGISLLNGVYAGMLTDWDVDPLGRDVTRFDAVNRLGLTHAKSGNGIYAGVKLLNAEYGPSYYPMSDQILGDPSQNGGGLTIREKFETLSSGVKVASLGETSPDGLDVMFVSGYGPLSIPANGSVKIAFAYLAGDNLTDLQLNAQAAQRAYNERIRPESLLPGDVFTLDQNYPNPAIDQTVLGFSVPESGMTSISLYNTGGQMVREIVNSSLPKGIYNITLDLSDIESGIYLYKMVFKGKEKTLKMIVAK
jgi:serine protease